MSITSEIRLRIKKEGDVALTQLSAKLNDVASRSVVSNKKFKELATTLKQNDTQIKGKSINALNDYSRAWRELANSVDVTSREFREATREAQRFEREAAKAQGRRGGGRFMRAAQGVGAVASAGIFGGPEGFIGGLGGLAVGGVGGAVVGGAIGAYVKNLREGLGEIASFSAEIRRQEIALEGVVGTGNQYAFALESIRKATKDFAIPTSVLTREFTKLQASVQGAGGNVQDTDKTFRAIVSSIRATGGSIEDVRSALTATAQVFSKGKVSAEELRQQIGERLPGAFTLFAESIGKTPAELDKALEKGEVSLQDFMRFVELLLNRYEDNAKKIASGPEAAGDRLKVVLEDLKKTTGPILADIGASFQSFAADAIEAIGGLIKELGRFGREMEEKLGGKLLDNAIKNVKVQEKVIKQLEAEALVRVGGLTDEEKRRLSLARRLRAGSLKVIEGSKLGPELPTAPSSSTLPGAPTKEEKEKTKKIRTESAEILALSRQKNEADRDRNFLQVELLDYAMRTQKITEQFNAGEIDFNRAKKLDLENEQRLRKNILRLRTQEKREFANLSKNQKETNKELTETQKLGQSIVLTFADGMANALVNVFDRAQSFKELLGGILKQVGSLLLSFGMQGLAKGLFPALFPGRANGGPVRGRHPYIVGERGPELFVPGQSGEIVPNHMIDLGGKFLPMHPLFLAAMAGVGNFGGRRQDFMRYMIGGQNFGHAMPRANGGPVSAGSKYLVGERGPEMYVPRGSAGGRAVNVGAINISVQNSGEQLSPAAQKQIANQVQGIVMSSLVNERRSGGLLR